MEITKENLEAIGFEYETSNGWQEASKGCITIKCRPEGGWFILIESEPYYSVESKELSFEDIKELDRILNGNN